MDPTTGERVPQTTPYLYNGAEFNLNSFVSHVFEVREVPSAQTGVCKGADQQCHMQTFVVNENEDQVVYVRPGINLSHTDNLSNAQDSAEQLLSDCQDEALKALGDAGDLTREAVEKILADVTDCVEGSVTGQLMRSNEEISFQKQIRTGMAEHWENYTCADYGLGSSEPKERTTWQDSRGRRRQVQIMLDRPASRIHLVDNFISEAECDAMEKAAASKLHDATVADGSGGSTKSNTRKAKQAGIKVPWEDPGSPIVALSSRVYEYVNNVLDLDIKHNGQEDLMSIQYFGRGLEDKEPDRYTPHCDGECTGNNFKPGNRMATMVIYCTIPEIGGATNFRNSGIHVVPKKGSATFFSYINPDGMQMDNGFTEHSGCPVVQGEKKIVTQWVRLGVDDENPWDAFNTLGIKHKDAMNQ